MVLLRTGVLSNKSKQREGRNDHKGVGKAIVPMKQVTTAEGRAWGKIVLGGGNGER